MSTSPAVAAWHEVVATHDPERLDALLSNDVVFRSPAVHTPQEGRALTTAYLRAAIVVLGPSLTYHRELVQGDSAVLEFTADLDGTLLHGIDFLRWNADDQLIEFTVMVRPLTGLQTLIERMGAELQRGS